jgi:DNA-binding beta-propeller fold protein YncE
MRGLNRAHPLIRFYLPLAAVLILAVVFSSLLGASPGDTIADRELGQADFVHSTNPSFVRQKSLSLQGDPRGGNGVAVDQALGHIYVADHNNNRVLGWNNVSSFTSGQDADLVIGVSDFFTAPPQCFDFPNGFCGPYGLTVDPSNGNLWISDERSLTEVNAPFSQTGPAILLTSNATNAAHIGDCN